MRIGLWFDRLCESSGRAGGEIVDIQIAVESDFGIAIVVGELALSKSKPRRVGLLNRDSLGLCTGSRADAKLFRRLTPIGARLEPGEVDPLAVGAPVDIGGLPAVELGAAHDVLDGEVEWPGLLRGNRLHSEQQ